MCDVIRTVNGLNITTVKQFQEYFNVDARKYGWNGRLTTLNFCMCEINLFDFFRDHPEYKFQYNCGDWWED